jgi:hypothetical protein
MSVATKRLLLAVLTHSNGGAHAANGRYKPSRKNVRTRNRFRLYSGGRGCDSAHKAVNEGGTQFGLLQYAGHVRPE